MQTPFIFLRSGSKACTCQLTLTKERSIVYLHKMEYICIIQTVTFYIALILNVYFVFRGDKGWEAARTSYICVYLKVHPALKWVGINPWVYLSSQMSVLLLLSSEHQRYFSPHFSPIPLCRALLKSWKQTHKCSEVHAGWEFRLKYPKLGFAKIISKLVHLRFLYNKF